jgi:hypothetical protein
LSERLGPSQAALILLASKSGDFADSVAAVQKLAPVCRRQTAYLPSFSLLGSVRFDFENTRLRRLT